MDIVDIQKKFPSVFPQNVPPKEAKEESIEVYRLCTTGAVEPESFLPTYLETKRLKEFDASDPGGYSLSSFETEKDALTIFSLIGKHYPKPILAKGTTDPSCGVTQRTRDRIKRKSLKSHVDWWLYEDAAPHVFFQKVDLTPDNSKEGSQNENS